MSIFALSHTNIVVRSAENMAFSTAHTYIATNLIVVRAKSSLHFLQIGENMAVVMHYAYWINHFARKVNATSEKKKWESIKHLILMWPITSDIKTQANACGKHKRFSRTTNQQIAFKTQLQWKGQFSMSVKLGYCGIWNSFFISALATRHSYITRVMWQKAKCALHTNKSDDILSGREHIKKNEWEHDENVIFILYPVTYQCDSVIRITSGILMKKHIFFYLFALVVNNSEKDGYKRF